MRLDAAVDERFTMTTPTRIGSVIAGKYLVERVLGRGGMGVVVVARHLQLGERVAIKFPVARMGARADLGARWLREGRAAMRIRSQHVARVYDVGSLDTGEPYLVMEYLEGRDLADVVADDGPLPVEKAVEYILQSTEALAEAHAQGIIHRDLKPSNLFLTRSADGSAITKVLDFGTAKTLAVALETPLTGPAAVIGTPLFMAPEQMRSKGEVDARADIWALGATLYTLLIGEPPFSAGSLLEIYESILHGCPSLRDKRPEAPEALETALMRCMQADPNRRYADVAELANALAEVAPEHARISAARAARILRAPPNVADRAASGDRPVFIESDRTPSPPTAPSTHASWEDADAVGAMGTSMPPPAPRSHGAATTPRRWRRSYSWLLVALAGALAAGGLDATVRARRPGGASPPFAQATAITVPVSPPTSALQLVSQPLSDSTPLPLPEPARVPRAAAALSASLPSMAHPRSSAPIAAPVARDPRSVTVADAGPSPHAPSRVRDPLADPD